MRLPNKVNPYQQSVIAKYPIVLKALEQEDMSVSALYYAVRKKMDDVGDFMEVIDCLYALGQIEYITEKRSLHYVARNKK